MLSSITDLCSKMFCCMGQGDKTIGFSDIPTSQQFMVSGLVGVSLNVEGREVICTPFLKLLTVCSSGGFESPVPDDKRFSGFNSKLFMVLKPNDDVCPIWVLTYVKFSRLEGFKWNQFLLVVVSL